MLEYHEKRAEIRAEPQTYVLSDGEPDRMEDVIEPEGWQLGKFAPAALFNHNRNWVIGKWSDVDVKGGQLIGTLNLAEEDTSPVTKMVHALVRQGLLDTVSVGFRAIEKEPIDKKDPWGGIRFKKVELLEASLVSVAANPRARRIIKQFFSDDELGMNAQGSSSRTGMIAEVKTPSIRTRTMTIQTPVGANLPLDERIKRDEQRLVALRDQMTELDRKIAAQDVPTEEQTAEVELIGAEIDTLSRAIQTNKAIERRVKLQIEGTVKGGAAPAVIPRIRRDIRKGEHLIRTAIAIVQARQMQIRGQMGITPEDVLEQRWPGEEESRIVLKAAVNPAATTVAGWAQELVETTYADFQNLLPRSSLYNAISGRGQRFNFGRAGIIKIPGRAATPTINGSFVGEGQPIPVRKGAVTAITLTQKKMAVISTFTQELAQSSTPSIESVIRDMILFDTSAALDTVLIDATAADTIRPAGLRNGVAGLTPSAATATIDKIIADLKALEAEITKNRGGRNLLLMMNPAQAGGLRWAQTQGIWMFPDSANVRDIPFVVSDIVPVTELIMIDAADFASVTGDSPEFSVSDQATVHEEDTTPLPISATGTPNTVAAPVRSFWQTYSVGIRMILPMNWTMVRAGMVAWMTGVTW